LELRFIYVPVLNKKTRIIRAVVRTNGDELLILDDTNVFFGECAGGVVRIQARCNRISDCFLGGAV
jgi:hypothetical protein